jgi:hypothetical protein
MTAPHETYNLENITVLDFIYQHPKGGFDHETVN